MGPCSRTPSGPAVQSRLHQQAEQKIAPDQRQYVKFLLQCGSHPQKVPRRPAVASNADVRSSGGSCSDADAVTHGRASSCVGCVKRHSQAAGRRAWDACSNMALALRLQRRWEGREVLSLPSWPFSRLVAAAGQPGQDGGTSLDCPATPASTQIGKMPVIPQRSAAGPARRSLHAVSAATSADPAAAAPSRRQSR